MTAALAVEIFIMRRKSRSLDDINGLLKGSRVYSLMSRREARLTNLAYVSSILSNMWDWHAWYITFRPTQPHD